MNFKYFTIMAVSLVSILPSIQRAHASVPEGYYKGTMSFQGGKRSSETVHIFIRHDNLKGARDQYASGLTYGMILRGSINDQTDDGWAGIFRIEKVGNTLAWLPIIHSNDAKEIRNGREVTVPGTKMLIVEKEFEPAFIGTIDHEENTLDLSPPAPRGEGDQLRFYRGNIRACKDSSFIWTDIPFEATKEIDDSGNKLQNVRFVPEKSRADAPYLSAATLTGKISLPVPEAKDRNTLQPLRVDEVFGNFATVREQTMNLLTGGGFDVKRDIHSVLTAFRGNYMFNHYDRFLMMTCPEGKIGWCRYLVLEEE